MKKEEKLVNKVKRLLRKAKFPRYLHHYGPKTYKFWQHAFALIAKAMFRLSYRRTSNLLRLLGFNVASKSTIHRYARKLPVGLWQKLLKATVDNTVDISAIDGTGLSRTSQSWHYIKRIDRDPDNTFYKLSVCVDVKKRKILCLRVRAKRASDIKDVKNLIKNLPAKPNLCIMDKSYDAEWLHQFLHSKNIKSIIPARNHAKSRHYTKGKFRKEMKYNFSKYKKIYNQRNIVESLIFAYKKLFGDSVSSKLITSARAEVYCRAIAYNLFFIIIRLLGQRL
jgi:transposase